MKHVAGCHNTVCPARLQGGALVEMPSCSSVRASMLQSEARSTNHALQMVLQSAACGARGGGRVRTRRFDGPAALGCAAPLDRLLYHEEKVHHLIQKLDKYPAPRIE
eukprot:2320970-Pleurochrysis_carterae.AAC.1